MNLRAHTMSMTYKPKVEKVFSGECTQTTRIGERFKAGDKILIHEWLGKPYRSKWGRRLKVEVTEIIRMEAGTYEYFQLEHMKDMSLGLALFKSGSIFWEVYLNVFNDNISEIFNQIAEKDGVVPATGEEYLRVLEELNKHKFVQPSPLRHVCITGYDLRKGVPFQIIRWKVLA